MITKKPMSRWQAAGIHVGISVLIGILVALLLFGVWYPPPYFVAGGADHLMLVLVSVDLVLGPLLTLVVFKAGKWGMKFDLFAIGVFQACALAYGLHVMAASRPVFLVGNLDRFVLVAANEIEDSDLAKGHGDEFRTRSWLGARLAGARIADEKARQELISAAILGKDIQNYPEYFVPYSTVTPELLRRAKPLDELRKRRGASPVIDGWLQKSGRQAADIVWLPVTARMADLSMLMDRASGEPLQALAIDPW